MRASQIAADSAIGHADRVHNGQCEVCGVVSQLDQHHIQPKGMGGSKDPAVEAPENKITLCRTCHRNIHHHRWVLQRSDHELRVVHPRTGELVMRRLFNRDFDAPSFFHQLAVSEDGLERLIEDIPYLTDEQLVEAFACSRSLGKRAWVIEAAILYEAQQRSVYGDHSLGARLLSRVLVRGNSSTGTQGVGKGAIRRTGVARGRSKGALGFLMNSGQVFRPQPAPCGA